MITAPLSYLRELWLQTVASFISAPATSLLHQLPHPLGPSEFLEVTSPELACSHQQPRLLSAVQDLLFARCNKTCPVTYTAEKS